MVDNAPTFKSSSYKFESFLAGLLDKGSREVYSGRGWHVNAMAAWGVNIGGTGTILFICHRN